MPDTIFIFALALVIFGPKKLPEIGRQLGKLVAEFRRASNEFKMQIDEELRASEQNDRQKQFAIDAIAPSAATVETRELPASLTVKPPSTGEIENAEGPFKPYRSEEIEAGQHQDLSQDFPAEEGPYYRDEEAYGRAEGAYGRVEEAYGQEEAYGRVEEAYQERAGGLENAPPQPDVPAVSEEPSAADRAAGTLEEQATNHHG